MKIKTTTLAAGPKGITPADTELEVSEEIGRAMIKSGAAVEVGTQKPSRETSAETAALGGEETAATRIGRGSPKKRGR